MSCFAGVLGCLDSTDSYFGSVNFLLVLDFRVCMLFFRVCFCFLYVYAFVFNFSVEFCFVFFTCIFGRWVCVNVYMYKLHYNMETSLLYIYFIYYKKCIFV